MFGGPPGIPRGLWLSLAVLPTFAESALGHTAESGSQTTNSPPLILFEDKGAGCSDIPTIREDKGSSSTDVPTSVGDDQGENNYGQWGDASEADSEDTPPPLTEACIENVKKYVL